MEAVRVLIDNGEPPETRVGFWDVDEFLVYEPSRSPHSPRSAATALAAALSGQAGAVKLESHVMLPDRLSWGGASDDRLFLTRNYSRQLLQPVSREERLRRGELGFRKNVVDPRALGVLDGLHYYSTIHRVALRGDKVQKVIGHSLGLSLLHFLCVCLARHVGLVRRLAGHCFVADGAGAFFDRLHTTRTSYEEMSGEFPQKAPLK